MCSSCPHQALSNKTGEVGKTGMFYSILTSKIHGIYFASTLASCRCSHAQEPHHQEHLNNEQVDQAARAEEAQMDLSCTTSLSIKWRDVDLMAGPLRG